jgi:hypothetical protein
LDEIGKILPALFRREIQRTDPRLVEFLDPFWPRVAGKAIALHSRPVSFEAGTLTLATDCSTWSTQLHQMAEEIRAEVNSFLGKPLVRKLRVRKVPELRSFEPPPLREHVPFAREKLERIKLANATTGDREVDRVFELSYAKYFARAGRHLY